MNKLAVFFDLDGTLLDTAKDLVPAVIDTINQAKLPITENAENKIKAAVAFGSKAMIEAALDLEKITNSSQKDLLEELIKKLHTNYIKTAGNKADFFPNMEDLLVYLNTKKIPCAIVTDKNSAFTKEIIEKKNLNSFFSAYICGDTLQVRKPNPQVLLYACGLVNTLPEKAIYLGDTEKDILCAKQAGLKSIFCTWGYGKLNNIQADFLAKNTLEVKKIITEIIRGNNHG